MTTNENEEMRNNNLENIVNENLSTDNNEINHNTAADLMVKKNNTTNNSDRERVIIAYENGDPIKNISRKFQIKKTVIAFV